MNIAAIMLPGLELQKISLHAWGIKISLDAIKMKFLHYCPYRQLKGPKWLPLMQDSTVFTAEN